MKLGIIAHLKHAIREPFAGGLEMHTHMLARMLRARGHQVTVFAATRSDPALGVEPICPQTTLADAGTEEATDTAFFLEHHAYLHLMSRLRDADFDVVHNNSLHYLPASMSGTLPMPVVTTLHTPPFCWLESGLRCGPAAGTPGAGTLVAVSCRTAELWSGIVAVDAVVPNGIDLARFTFRARPARPAYWVWSGRIVPEKGTHFAIAAAQRAGARLRIAGPVADPGYFASHVAPHLSARITHEGHLGHAALARLVAGASVALCTPCWEEPYGLVVAEALACGTPVAGFNRGALPELLDPSCGVLCAPGDAAALARSARAAARLSRAACRARAEAACDAETMIDAYEALYTRLRQPPPAP